MPSLLPSQVCEQRGLVREMVFVLGRMGSAEKALRLIVEGLRDVAQVGMLQQRARAQACVLVLHGYSAVDFPRPELLLSGSNACHDSSLQAVEFVQLQRDDDLWEQLIALTLGDAQLTGAPAGDAVAQPPCLACPVGCGMQHSQLRAHAPRNALLRRFPCAMQDRCWTTREGTSTRCGWCPRSLRTCRWGFFPARFDLACMHPGRNVDAQQ